MVTCELSTKSDSQIMNVSQYTPEIFQEFISFGIITNFLGNFVMFSSIKNILAVNVQKSLIF